MKWIPVFSFFVNNPAIIVQAEFDTQEECQAYCDKVNTKLFQAEFEEKLVPYQSDGTGSSLVNITLRDV